MPLLLRAAKEPDTRKLGIISRDAFRDSLSRAFFPPHLASKSETGDPALDEAQWRDVRVLRRMREGKPTYVVVDVPEDEADGEEVVGFAQWELPSGSTAPAEAAAETEKDPLPGSLDRETLLKVYAALEAETKKALGPDGHSKMWCKLAVVLVNVRSKLNEMPPKQTSCFSPSIPTNNVAALAGCSLTMDLSSLQRMGRTSISLRPLLAEVYTILSASAILGNQLTCAEPLTIPCCGQRRVPLLLEVTVISRGGFDTYFIRSQGSDAPAYRSRRRSKMGNGNLKPSLA
jgi:hypothetical protein